MFECADDDAVAGQLLGEAARWAAARGADRLLGPCTYLPEQEAGMAVDGFDVRPASFQSYNPPYYARLVEQSGFRVSKVMHTYRFTRPSVEPLRPRLTRLQEFASTRGSYRCREADLSSVDREIDVLAGLLTDSFGGNSEISQFHSDLLRYEAKALRPFLDSRFLLFVESKGQPVGALLGVPDMNPLLARLGGRIGPVGAYRALVYPKRINGVVIALVGILPDHRNTMALTALLTTLILNVLDSRLEVARTSWIDEDNAAILSVIARLGAEAEREYRLYERTLS
jgi:hypothetical protein